MEALAFSVIVGLLAEQRMAVGRLGDRLATLEGAHKVAMAEAAGRCPGSMIHGGIAICITAITFCATRCMIG